MACLTEEQLARLALGLDEGGPLSAHVDECEACLAKLAEMRAIVGRLSGAHAELDRAHAVSRSRLLASLLHETRPVRPAARIWTRLASRFGHLTARQRIAVGGIGLSAAALVFLMFVLVSPATRLSAMERMIKAVRQVSSYSYQLTETVTRNPPLGHSFQVQITTSTSWQAPGPSQSDTFGSLYSKLDIRKTQIEGGKPEPVSDVVEIHPAGKPGILINYIDKYYFWTPVLGAGDIPPNSPMAKLRAVRDSEGRIVRDLGTKQIEGREAHGYIVAFDGAAPFRNVDQVEVWIDPETDLPLEFSYRSDWEQDGRQVPDEIRVTDCRWNIPIDPKLFYTAPPEGYTNTTPPNKQADIDEIVSALRLYSRLSGHYPQVVKSDATALHDEMLKLAGCTGPPQPAWADNEEYQQIQQATVGLDWLARILLDKYHSGYFGREVGPEDKDKVLLWWPDRVWDADNLYRVFYGDLHSEVVTPKRFAELLPAESDRLGIGEDGQE
jgi:hypothetical protein